MPLQRSDPSRPGPSTGWLAALALGALAVGLAIYLLDRPAGSAMLLPASWQRGVGAAGALPSIFGAAGEWLPSLVHAFAFSVLTALVWPWARLRAAAPCVLWAAVDSLAEVGQHPLFAPPLAQWLDAASGGAAPALAVGRYLTQGSFDAADLVAGVAGAASAYVLLRWLRRG